MSTMEDMSHIDAEMRKFLEGQAKFDRTRYPDWQFGGMAELVLAYGRFFTRGTAPARRGSWNRKKKSCYMNAYFNAQNDPLRFIYCEGFCGGTDQCPFAHAWFVDRKQPDVALDT